MTKRLIATIMTIIMVIGILPVTATAAYNRGGSWDSTLPELPTTEDNASEEPVSINEIGELSEPYLVPQDNGYDIDYAVSYERLAGANTFTLFAEETSGLENYIAQQILVSGNYENTVINDLFGENVIVIDISRYSLPFTGNGEYDREVINNLIARALASDPYLYNTFNYSSCTTTKNTNDGFYKYIIITPSQSCEVLTAARTQLETTVNALINRIHTEIPNATPEELALYAHDYIVLNATGNSSEAFYDNTAFNVFCGNSGTSKGYAAAYTLLLEKLGVPAIVVRSENLKLSWNQVQLGNQWYHVDTYSDDATPLANTDKYIEYKNFLINDSECVAIKNIYDINGAQPSDSATYSAMPHNNNGNQIYDYNTKNWYYTSGYNILSSAMNGSNITVASPTTDFYDGICKDASGRYFVSAMGAIYYWDIANNTMNPYFSLNNPNNFQIKHMYFIGETVYFIYYNINAQNYNSSDFTPAAPTASVAITSENGAYVTLSCNAYSNGFLSYKWQKAADIEETVWEDMADEEASSITIFKEDITTPYIFRCIVTNSCFKSVDTESITVDFSDQTSGFTNADYENALNTAKSYVSTLNASKYTASSYTALTDAIASAENCLESDAGNHILELNDAVEALAVRSIPTPSIDSCVIAGSKMDYTVKMPWDTTDEMKDNYFTEYEHGFIYIRASRLTSGSFTVNTSGRTIVKLGSYTNRINTNTSSCSVSSSTNYYVRAYTRYYNENGVLVYTYSSLMLVQP